MKKHNFNKNTFIQGWYIPGKVCDNLISFFKKNKHRHVQGSTGKGINLEVKDSTDICIRNSDSALDEYNEHLKHCISEYEKSYYGLSNIGSFSSDVETVNIQYYKPGGGFKEWHFERHRDLPHRDRLLVFMTYLNDVPDGGTEFMYQNIVSPAKKGLTLIWPAEFTHTHRGQISKTKEKYIITGWFNFLP